MGKGLRGLGLNGDKIKGEVEVKEAERERERESWSRNLKFEICRHVRSALNDG